MSCDSLTKDLFKLFQESSLFPGFLAYPVIFPGFSMAWKLHDKGCAVTLCKVLKSRSYLWEPGRGCSGRCRWPSGWSVGAAGPRRGAAWPGTPPAAAGLAVHLGDRRRKRQRWVGDTTEQSRAVAAAGSFWASTTNENWSETRRQQSAASTQQTSVVLVWMNSCFTAAIIPQCWNTELHWLYADIRA